LFDKVQALLTSLISWCSHQVYFWS